jgi:multidrug resistance efflux pump
MMTSTPDLTPLADLPPSELIDRLRAELQRRTTLEAELAGERQLVAELSEEVENPRECEGARGGEKFCGRCPGCVRVAREQALAERQRADALAAAGEVLSQRVDDLETAAEGLQVQVETITQREQETVATLRAEVAQLQQALEVAREQARRASEWGER